MAGLERLRERARRLKADVVALYLVARDPRTPLPVKVLIGCIVAYALSPIDLIPDFIPVLGLLDEVILLPIAIALVLRLVPPRVMADARAGAPAALARARRLGIVGLVIVVGIWIAVAAFVIAGVRWLVDSAR